MLLVRSIVGDRSRFADRSRELWSEQSTSETRYKQSSSLIALVNETHPIDERSIFLAFLSCCGSCPFASLLAFVLTLTGTAICCGCLYYPIRATIELVNNVFETEYIDFDW